MIEQQCGFHGADIFLHRLVVEAGSGGYRGCVGDVPYVGVEESSNRFNSRDIVDLDPFQDILHQNRVEDAVQIIPAESISQFWIDNR